VLQLGREPDAPWVTSHGPRQAHLDDFDLHADVCVPAGDRARLEQLCRYVLRPAIAQERLSLMPDGRVVVRLKAEWHDGTTALVFEPIELLEKVAALTPRPRVNLVLYHGVLAPHARLRERAVAYGRPEEPSASPAAETPRSSSGRRYWAWADLMRRAFEVDVLACPRCGGRMQLIATIEDPAVIRKIVTHLGIPADLPTPRSPPRTDDRLAF
jgi:hypothetical protein